MIKTKIGIRISLGTQWRIADTVTLEQISTSIVATPRPMAFVTVEVTASNGHIPSNCTKPGLFFHKPCMANSLYSAFRSAVACDFSAAASCASMLSVMLSVTSASLLFCGAISLSISSLLLYWCSCLVSCLVRLMIRTRCHWRCICNCRSNKYVATSVGPS